MAVEAQVGAVGFSIAVFAGETEAVRAITGWAITGWYGD